MKRLAGLLESARLKGIQIVAPGLGDKLGHSTDLRTVSNMYFYLNKVAIDLLLSVQTYSNSRILGNG